MTVDITAFTLYLIQKYTPLWKLLLFWDLSF